MPDLANLSVSSSLTLTRCASLKPLSPDSATQSSPPDSAVQTLVLTGGELCSSEKKACVNGNGSAVKVVRRSRGAKKVASLEDHVTAWIRKKMELGVPQSKCSLPFLVGAKKMVCFPCFFFF